MGYPDFSAGVLLLLDSSFVSVLLSPSPSLTDVLFLLSCSATGEVVAGEVRILSCLDTCSVWPENCCFGPSGAR